MYVDWLHTIICMEKKSYRMTVNTKGAPAVRASLFPTYAHAIPTY